MPDLSILTLLGVLILPHFTIAQKNISGYSRWQFTTYFTYNGGFGISAGNGLWIERKGIIQPALNISGNFVFSKHNLANKNRAGSRLQFNGVITPIAIFKLSPRNGYYESINTFYFGNSNAVMSNFSYHLAFGSNFIINPKTNKSLSDNVFKLQKLNVPNIYSTKNRAQQQLYLGARFGGTYKQDHSPSFSVKFNLYEDHMLIPTLFSGFADHFDRFYTGGGNLEFSFYRPGMSNGPWKIVLYDDVYTGTFEREMFDHPDIYDLKADNFASNSTMRRRVGRFVVQEPGQKLFNSGRFFGYVEVPFSTNSGKLPPFSGPLNLRILLGVQGGENSMEFQNLIHNSTTIDKINPNVGTEELYIRKGSDKKHFERLHHFYPATRKGRFIWGISTSVAPLKTNK